MLLCGIFCAGVAVRVLLYGSWFADIAFAVVALLCGVHAGTCAGVVLALPGKTVTMPFEVMLGCVFSYIKKVADIARILSCIRRLSQTSR